MKILELFDFSRSVSPTCFQRVFDDFFNLFQSCIVPIFVFCAPNFHAWKSRPRSPNLKKNVILLLLEVLQCPPMVTIAYVSLEICPIVQMDQLCSVGHSWVTPEIQFPLQVLRTPCLSKHISIYYKGVCEK